MLLQNRSQINGNLRVNMNVVRNKQEDLRADMNINNRYSRTR